MKTVFNITLFLLPIIAASQNKLVKISGKINSSDLKEISIIKLGLRSHLTYNPDFTIKIDPAGRFSDSISIPSASFYKIGDGWFGHKIFLRPGDSVFITLSKIPGLQTRMEKGEYFKRFHTMSVSAPFPKNFTFFDEIDERFKLPIKYSGSNRSIEQHKQKVDEVFNEEIKILEDYQKRNLVSTDFVIFSVAELRALYILFLGEPLYEVSRSNLPKNYLEIPFNIELNDSVFAVSIEEYMNAASIYNIYFYNEYNTKSPYSDLDNQFASAIKNYDGIVRDRLVGWLVEDYADKNYPGYDSIYNLFLQQCSNQVIKNSVIKKVAQKQELLKSKQKVRDENKISFVNAVNETFVEDLNGKKVRLRTLFPENKITIIDCWASWCGPCIDQIPHIDEIEKEYKTKVNFLYLSFDKDAIKWKDAINKYKSNSNNEYIIHNDFDSFFSGYFDLETIPRYILIGKNGAQVLDDNMIRPSDQTGFKEVLDNYLKK